MRMTRRFWMSLVIGAALVSGIGQAAAQGRDVLVFAAASLKNALDRIGPLRRAAMREGVTPYVGLPALMQGS